VITLGVIADIFAGGPGSGCHGPNCGRPMSAKERVDFFHRQFLGLKKQEANALRAKWIQDQIKQSGQVNTKAARTWWRREFKRQSRLAQPPAKVNLNLTKKQAKWMKKNAQRVRRNQPAPVIKVQPVAKRNVKKQFTTSDGTKVTIIKPPGQKEKTGQTWLIRESPYKGQFVQSLDTKADFKDNTKVAFFIARDPEKERGVAVQVLRNFGEKKTSVTEIDLLQYDAMARSRQATFSNMGRASGFLAKRYGISFKFT
jgi:hypothetical protein